jgi:hypothetical protein
MGRPQGMTRFPALCAAHAIRTRVGVAPTRAPHSHRTGNLRLKPNEPAVPTLISVRGVICACINLGGGESFTSVTNGSRTRPATADTYNQSREFETEGQDQVLLAIGT